MHFKCQNYTVALEGHWESLLLRFSTKIFDVLQQGSILLLVFPPSKMCCTKRSSGSNQQKTCFPYFYGADSVLWESESPLNVCINKLI